jgi:hypothetical protein
MRPFLRRLKKVLLQFSFSLVLFPPPFHPPYLPEKRVRAQARVRLHDVVAGPEREDPGDELAVGSSAAAAAMGVGFVRREDGPEVGELAKDLCFLCAVREFIVLFQCREG